jgi:hypothetical protein
LVNNVRPVRAVDDGLVIVTDKALSFRSSCFIVTAVVHFARSRVPDVDIFAHGLEVVLDDRL